MRISTATVSISVLFISLIWLGDTTSPPVAILSPFLPDSVSYDQGKLMIVSVEKTNVPSLLVSTQWSMTRFMDLSPVVSKQNFPRDFYRLFDTSATLHFVIYSFRYYDAYSVPETLSFAYRDSVTIRSLWAMPAFLKLAQDAQSSEVLAMVLTLQGWKDSTCTPVYDDPNSDGRALYKLHVQLIPGWNKIYFGAPGHRTQALEYTTNFTAGYQAIEDRPTHFHNSTLEQSCTTCHDGLPSADIGQTMKADCSVCHKTFTGAAYLHSPVEMKECGTCHAWSAEKKVVAATKPVPDLCFDCHAEKKALIDSAASQHPIAGECLTCHSPHGTNIKHQLKTDVYTLCTGCHEKYKINHPVGKHPVRFAKTGRMDDEISCVSCHNPHGSPNQSLLRVGGGRMAICLECHDK